MDGLTIDDRSARFRPAGANVPSAPGRSARASAQLTVPHADRSCGTFQLAEV